jgi:hypothetical protein
MCQIGLIHWFYAAGGANGSPWWWCLWDSCIGGQQYFPYYSYRTSDRILLAVKLF